jgi:hypothetical protein
VNEPKLYTPEEGAKKLRQFAELTAHNSQNWDNFEAIALEFITAAMNAARKWAEQEQGQ